MSKAQEETMDSQPDLSDLSQDAIMEHVFSRMDETGDLPIFSASVNRIQMVGSDPDSDAMGLAMEVLNDANLTTKVLKLANSSYYNRGSIKVGALSRAIVRLGFDTIKSTVLTLKLIDSFQQDHPAIEMNKLLVNSYMSAGFVREVAITCGAKDAELSYVCGLMHNLGEVIVAYTLPEQYIEMQRLAKQEGQSWAEAQQAVLGLPIVKVGQLAAEKWEFPGSVTSSIAPFKALGNKALSDKHQLNRALASLTHQLMDLLYSEHPNTTLSFADITKQLSTAAGVNTEVIGNCFDKSFKQSCDLAETYGLDKKRLQPKLRVNGTDDDRDRMARQLAFYISSKQPELAPCNTVETSLDDGYDAEPEELLSPEEEAMRLCKATTAESGNAATMLSVLHEITTMMTQRAHLNTVFQKILEGMHHGVGFDRALLCLLSPDRKSYFGRLSLGHRADELKRYFRQMPVQPQKDLFSKLIMNGVEVLVPDCRQGNWAHLLPAKFTETLGVTSFLIAALRVRGRPVGMFYVDNCQSKAPIVADDQRGFMQLVAQAHLALQVS